MAESFKFFNGSHFPFSEDGWKNGFRLNINDLNQEYPPLLNDVDVMAFIYWNLARINIRSEAFIDSASTVANMDSNYANTGIDRALNGSNGALGSPLVFSKSISTIINGTGTSGVDVTIERTAGNLVVGTNIGLYKLFNDTPGDNDDGLFGYGWYQFAQAFSQSVSTDPSIPPFQYSSKNETKTFSTFWVDIPTGATVTTESIETPVGPFNIYVATQQTTSSGLTPAAPNVSVDFNGFEFVSYDS